MAERGSIRNARSEGLEVPQVTQSAQKGGGGVRNSLALRVLGLLLNVGLFDPVGDQEGRDTTTDTVEWQGVFLAIGSAGGVAKVVGSRSQWRGHVVVEATGLIKRNKEQGVVPLGRGKERLVDFLQEGLAVRDQAGRVHGVGANTAARWVDVGELGELARGGISVEVRNGLNVVIVSTVVSPVEEGGVRASTTGRVIVVLPGVAGLVQLLEDGPLGEAVNALVKGIIVDTMAIRGSRDHISTVRVCGLSRCQQISDILTGV